ncbi:MAG TPA: NADH-quinone oxidoreductase subunit NuoH [Chloroflexota bacterium]|nr:NADH-quinone oxidoreductase subunit NuoH [Chloroflexota bacterium]
MPWLEAGWGAVRSVVLIFLLLTGMAYMTWFERRVISRLQVRVGPNRVGVSGLLQPLADAIKLFFKEDIRPTRADWILFPLAPAISLFAALAAFAVIPVGPVLNVAGVTMPYGIANVSVGLLYLIGVSSLGVYGLVLGGWASGSKYSLIGGLRAAAQVVSYELILGMALVSVAVVAGTLSLNGIVNQQAGHIPFFILQPLAFLLYLVAAVAETNRAPFDLPEADTELVAGYHTEYGGMRFAMFFIAEYINVITVSALAATMFFAGWSGPILPGPHWLFIKMLVFLFLFVWLRATLPRLRYDQLMRLCWSVLLPLALINLLATAIAVAAIP